MREIKFRAWDKIKKKFYIKYGSYKGYVNNEINLYINLEGNIYESDINGMLHDCESNKNRLEIMQYTGLKDNNGKEIYEGDIDKSEVIIKWCDKCCNLQLFLCGDVNYCLECNGDVHWLEYVHDYDRYIIGNIYENPELAKHGI